VKLHIFVKLLLYTLHCGCLLFCALEKLLLSYINSATISMVNKDVYDVYIGNLALFCTKFISVFIIH